MCVSITADTFHTTSSTFSNFDFKMPEHSKHHCDCSARVGHRAVKAAKTPKYFSATHACTVDPASMCSIYFASVVSGLIEAGKLPGQY